MRRSNRTLRARISPVGWIALAFVAAGPNTLAPAAEIEGVTVLISWNVLQPTSGTLSTYTYDVATDTYYLATFGNFAGLHKVTRPTPGDPYQSDQYADLGTSTFPSDIFRFYRATDVPNGDLNVNFTGNPLLSGLLLNPVAVTISVPMPDAAGAPTATMMDVTYQPGELAFITDGGTDIRSAGTPQFDLTKKLYRWDLRDIGAATTSQPDYSTGKSGAASPNENPGGAFGTLNQADWNDVFTVAMTEEAMRTAYTAATGNVPSSSSSDNFGRQPAWSTDGQSLYAIDTGTIGGGLYKINAGTGATELIYSEDGANNVIAEPAVLSTLNRDLGAAFGAGDQILFDGNAMNGNPGGMSYVVDTGSGVSGVQTLFTGAQLSAYTGVAAGGVDSIATDSAGNIYFFEGGTASIHMMDAAGRFRSVLNRAQLFEVSETNDGQRNNGGVLLRLQTREVGPTTALTYRGDNDYVAAVQIFDGGDVNRDGIVDAADRQFFIEQINKTFHDGAPNPYAENSAALVDSYVDYINADLNGDTRPRTGGNPLAATPPTPQELLPGLLSGGVDYLDLAVLTQFTELLLGDFNWDGIALDEDDWAIFYTHFEQNPSTFGYNSFSWFDGDVSGPGLDGIPDGVVDQFDLYFLNLNVVPEPGTWALMLASLAGIAGCVWRHRRRKAV